MYKEKYLLHERQNNYKYGSLRTISMDTTSKCNLKCPHCYADTFMNQKEVPLPLLKKFMDEAYEMGVFHYVLQGGEPIVDMERLISVVAMTRPQETYITLVSNGFAMSKQTISTLKGIGIDKIAFSLDSAFREEHDNSRCKGSYDRVMQAIDDVIESGLLASISTVVTHHNIRSTSFKRIMSFAYRKKIRLDAQIAMPVGKWDGKRDMLITEEDAQYIVHLKKKLKKIPTGQDFINRDIFFNTDDHHCPAGVEFMAVTATGHILPCNFCQFSLGNISDTSLHDARNALIQNPWFQGSIKHCLLGEDPEFFNLYVAPYVNTPKPLDAYKLFSLEKQR